MTSEGGPFDTLLGAMVDSVEKAVMERQQAIVDHFIAETHRILGVTEATCSVCREDGQAPTT